MTVIHLKKKDVVKSSVKGVAIEFDHDKLAFILGVPGKNGICEYIKDVWEESKEKNQRDMTTLRKPFSQCASKLEKMVFGGVGTGENRRRDDDDEVSEEEVEEEEKDQTDFDWEAVVDEAAVEGESGSDDQFFYAQVDVEEPMMSLSDSSRSSYHPQLNRRKQDLQESTPRVPLVAFQKLS
ncbi:hypothetical protein Dimus_022810 [Dionaea muscipula]